MLKFINKTRQLFRQAYFCALFFMAIIPLLPEYLSFVAVLVACIFAVKDIRSREQAIQLGTIGKLLMIFCTYQTLTCFISTHPFHSLFVSLMWWFFFLGYLVLTNTLNGKRRFQQFLFMLTITAGIVGFIALIQYYINVANNGNTDSVWRWLDRLIYPLIDVGIVELPYGVRAYSTFSNPNLMAKYLVLVAPFVAAYNFMEKRKIYTVVGRICLVLTYIGVIFSFSRGGYLALILLAIALVIIHLRKKLLSILLYGTGALLLLPSAVIERLSSINRVGERELIWKYTIERISSSLLFGYGAGTQPTYEFLHNLNIQAAHAHNVVLQLLLEGGIIALVLMGAIGFKVIKDSIVLMLNKHESSFWVGFALCGFSVLLLVHGMVDNPFSTPKLVVNFITLLALAEKGYHLFPHKKGKTIKNK